MPSGGRHFTDGTIPPHLCHPPSVSRSHIWTRIWIADCRPLIASHTRRCPVWNKSPSNKLCMCRTSTTYRLDCTSSREMITLAGCTARAVRGSANGVQCVVIHAPASSGPIPPSLEMLTNDMNYPVP